MKSSLVLNRTIQYAVLIILALLLVFPIVFMTTDSFMSENEILSSYNSGAADKDMTNAANYSTINLIPEQVTFIQYYHALLRKPDFLVMFWNSVILAVPVMAGQIFISALGAYAFAKFRFPFREQIFFLFIIVMLMPYQVTLVPNYIILSKMNLLGSYLAIILPGIFTTFGVFLLRQFIMAIPDEYSESARIDGAGYMTIFRKIIIPQCKGGIASLAILNFIDNWNMVEQPLVFLKDKFKYPMSIFLSYMNSTDMGIAFACGILYMLPTIIVFLYGEEYLIKGIQLSGLK